MVISSQVGDNVTVISSRIGDNKLLSPIRLEITVSYLSLSKHTHTSVYFFIIIMEIHLYV